MFSIRQGFGSAFFFICHHIVYYHFSQKVTQTAKSGNYLKGWIVCNTKCSLEQQCIKNKGGNYGKTIKRLLFINCKDTKPRCNF
jgi:hypothetical protein